MRSQNTSLSVLAFMGGVLVAAVAAQAQPGRVLSHQKISDTEGGFGDVPDDLGQFDNL